MPLAHCACACLCRPGKHIQTDGRPRKLHLTLQNAWVPIHMWLGTEAITLLSITERFVGWRCTVLNPLRESRKWHPCPCPSLKVFCKHAESRRRLGLYSFMAANRAGAYTSGRHMQPWQATRGLRCRYDFLRSWNVPSDVELRFIW